MFLWEKYFNHFRTKYRTLKLLKKRFENIIGCWLVTYGFLCD